MSTHVDYISYPIITDPTSGTVVYRYDGVPLPSSKKRVDETLKQIKKTMMKHRKNEYAFKDHKNACQLYTRNTLRKLIAPTCVSYDAEELGKDLTDIQIEGDRLTRPDEISVLDTPGVNKHMNNVYWRIREHENRKFVYSLTGDRNIQNWMPTLEDTPLQQLDSFDLEDIERDENLKKQIQNQGIDTKSGFLKNKPLDISDTEWKHPKSFEQAVIREIKKQYTLDPNDQAIFCLRTVTQDEQNGHICLGIIWGNSFRSIDIQQIIHRQKHLMKTTIHRPGVSKNIPLSNMVR